MITFNIATVPRRKQFFLKVLQALSLQQVQCDKINIAMSYPYDKEVYDFVGNNFKDNSIIHGKFSCEQKFFAFDETDGYFLTFDDDIIYPGNYSRLLINGIDFYKRKAIAGFHGMKFRYFPVIDFYRDRKLYQYFDEVREDKKLDIIGSGVSGFHTSTLKSKGFSFDMLSQTKNMTDDVIGKFCRGNNIEMICLKHRPRWIRIMPNTQDEQSTWRVAHKNNHEQNLKLLNADTIRDTA